MLLSLPWAVRDLLKAPRGPEGLRQAPSYRRPEAALTRGLREDFLGPIGRIPLSWLEGGAGLVWGKEQRLLSHVPGSRRKWEWAAGPAAARAGAQGVTLAPVPPWSEILFQKFA